MVSRELTLRNVESGRKKNEKCSEKKEHAFDKNAVCIYNICWSPDAFTLLLPCYVPTSSIIQKHSRHYPVISRPTIARGRHAHEKQLAKRYATRHSNARSDIGREDSKELYNGQGISRSK